MLACARVHVCVRVCIACCPIWPLQGVGIRFKGYFGSLRICLVNWFDCRKLSYKLKFDMVNPEQRFFGLKRLQLHASISEYLPCGSKP